MAKLPYLAVSELLYASYFSYYLMIAGVGIALFFKDRREFFHFVSVISFLFYACYLCYIALPIVGPPVLFREIPDVHILGQFVAAALNHPYPEALKHGPLFQLMAWIYRVAEAPGAAFPSSHVAVALCTVFFSFRYLKRIRWLHLVLAVLLCLSTVYCRYHYVVDVLAGVATAAILVPLGNRLYFRFTPPEPASRA
jgi:membrane-associated phospholipid phosphatase